MVIFSADIIRSMKEKSTPKCQADIANRIICCGNFLATLNEINAFINSEYSSFAILRGNPGVGKKSLVKLAEQNFLQITIKSDDNNASNKRRCIAPPSRLKVIYLNPILFHDDYGAMRYIATELDMKIKPSVNEVLTDLTLRRGLKFKGKILIVLLNFEQFCRQRQSLLYSLTNLTQHGDNINILGLTTRINCTSDLEKRVRSRLNAVCYELNLPYQTKEEYVEFASDLLGKFEINKRLLENLEEMYIYGTRQIFDLKQYLIDLCEWDMRGRLTVRQPAKDAKPIKNGILDIGTCNEIEQCLYWLTKPQFELLKLIVCCFFAQNNKDLNMNDLNEWLLKRNVRGFDTTSLLTMNSLGILKKMNLIKQTKSCTMLCHMTDFSPEISPQEMRSFLERNSFYCNNTTDKLWKEIH